MSNLAICINCREPVIYYNPVCKDHKLGLSMQAGHVDIPKKEPTNRQEALKKICEYATMYVCHARGMPRERVFLAQKHPNKVLSRGMIVCAVRDLFATSRFGRVTLKEVSAVLGIPEGTAASGEQICRRKLNRNCTSEESANFKAEWVDLIQKLSSELRTKL